MAMKGVQGIAETIQAMEADSRARKRWDWEQEDRPFETARRKDAEAVRLALAGKGGYSNLSASGKADVDAELERAGSLGSGGLNQFLLSLSASKAGGTTGTGPIDYTNAQALVKNTLEETLANIAFKDADNPKLVKENQLKAIRAAYKTSPQALDETLWNATLSRSRGESDPTSDLVYEALKGHKDMSAAVMGKSKFISDAKANADATPEAKAMLQQQKMDAANVFSVLKEEQTGSARKFLNDKDIIDKIPFRENEDGSLTWSYNGKERTQKELEEVFSNPLNRQRFARKVALGEKEQRVSGPSSIGSIPLSPGSSNRPSSLGGWVEPTPAYTPNEEDLPPTDVFGNNLPGQDTPPAAPIDSLRSLPPEKLDALMQIISQMYNPRFKPVDKTQEPLRNRYPGPRRDMLR
jgi:hypothetical protein